MTSRTGDYSVILVDLYQASRGPIVRMDIQSAEALARLTGLLRTISEGKANEVSLASLDWIAFTPLVRDMRLKLTDSSKEPSRSVRLWVQPGVGTVVEWTRLSEGWLESAELLDGLRGEPGHQYLSRGSSDEAEIEVSFQEADPKRWAERLRGGT